MLTETAHASNEQITEESLDPTDWESLRSLGHQMLDDMLDYLQNIREEPTWRPLPAEALNFFQQPLPIDPGDEAQIYQEFQKFILPYRTGNIHPRFWGWVMGTGTPLSMLAEMLAAGINTNAGGGQQSAAYVEEQVIQWLKTMFAYPAEASGLLTSGGSVANLIGLTVARNQRAGYDLRQDGVAAAEKPLVLYASSQIHSSVIKAVELLGLGRNALREIAVDKNYAIDLQALQEAVARDRQAGFHPFCVVGAAGTTNTGAFDDLNALADLCLAENLWFHVDGAFGAFAALAPSVKHLAEGMTRADSLAFDLHKWFYLPFEVGCVLVRTETDHRHAFSLTADYLVHTSRGPAGGAVWPSDYGIQLSRGFRALKVWMAFKAHGTALIGRLVEQNIQQSRQLAALVQADPKLELMAPVPLNVVNFRYKAAGLTGKTLNAFNEELLLRLQESGVAVPSYTTLNGAYVLRACITNHRTRREDLTLVVQKVLELGQTLENEGFGRH